MRDRAILELFYSSGLRISELVGLNRTDIDFKTRLMRLKGKGKKERVIPITKNAACWILKYLENPERYLKTNEHLPQEDAAAIFLNKWGTRLTTRSIDRHFESYGISGFPEF